MCISYYEKIGGEVKCIDEEIPFDLPDGWAWTRMKNLMYLVNGVTYNKNDIQQCGIRILRGGNLSSNGNIMLFDDDIFLPEQYRDHNQIQIGDIVIVASTGSTTVIGRPAFVNDKFPHTQIGGFLKIVRPITSTCASILKLVFQTDYYHDAIVSLVGGVNINNIKASHLEEMLISIPTKSVLSRTEESLVNMLDQLNNLNIQITVS